MNISESQLGTETTAEREQEVNPYAEAAESIFEDKPHFNDKQLIRIIDERLLSVVVDRATQGEFAPKDQTESIDTDTQATGTASEVVSRLWLGAAARAAQNPNWIDLLPGDDNLKKMITLINKDARLARLYPYALKERATVLYEQDRKHQSEQGEVSPEVFELAEAVEHLGEEAVEQTVEEPKVIVDGLPDWETYQPKRSVEPIEDDSPYAPPSVLNTTKFEELAKPDVRIGDKYKILVQATDPSTGQPVEGVLTPDVLEVVGFEDDEGEFKVNVVNSAGKSKLISQDKLLSEHDAIRVFSEQFAAIEPTDNDRIVENNEINIVEYATIDTKVYVPSEGDERLREGRFMGFYNEGDAHMSYLKPLQYAGVKLSTGEVIGVSSSILLNTQQKQYRDRIFKPSALPKK